MNYLTVSRLRTEMSKVWRRLPFEKEFVVTRNGKPFAVLLHTLPAEVDESLRAWRAARDQQAALVRTPKR